VVSKRRSGLRIAIDAAAFLKLCLDRGALVIRRCRETGR